MHGSPREEESPGRSVDLDIPSTYLLTDTEIERKNQFDQTVLKIEQFDTTVQKMEVQLETIIKDKPKKSKPSLNHLK